MINENETLAQKFVRRGFWMYLFTFLAAPLAYIVKIILSHDLEVSEVGLFYGIISLISLLWAINDLWWTESLNYFLPKYIIRREYGKIKYLLKFVLKWQLLSSSLIIAFIFYFSHEIALNYFHSEHAEVLLKIFAFYFLWNNLIHICVALFSATQDTKLQKSTEFVRLLFTTIFTTIIFLADIGNILIYTWIWLGGVLIAILFSWFFAYKKYFVPYLKNIPTEKDLTLRRQFIKYAIPTFITANISLILSQIDSQIIIIMLGNEANGYYSNYLSIMTIPFIFLSPIIAFLFPVFTELHARKNIEKISLLYRSMFLYLSIISIWISLFLFQAGIPLTKLIFSEQYARSGEILQFSVPFLIFNVLNQLNFQLLAGTGRAWTRTISFAIVLPINVILNLIFINFFQEHGSALAVGISWIPLFLITFFATKKYFSLPPLKPIFLNILSGLLSFKIVYIIQEFFPNMESIEIIWMAIVIYTPLFFLFNFSLFREAIKIILSNRR